MDINNANALRCCELLHDYFINDQKIAKVDYPSNLVLGSIKWLIYIFYSCLLDYGMRSKIYHQNLINTYNKYPEIFEPKWVIKNENKILGILKDNVHPRYPNTSYQKWLKLSYKLAEYDDILLVIKNFKTFNELKEFIKRLGTYGQKTGGLLLRLIVDAKICAFDDELDFIPLDRHDMEISFWCGVTNSLNLSPSQIKTLSDIWINNAKKVGTQASSIDKYLWEVGNRFCNKKDCVNCPLKSVCKKIY